MTTTTSKSNMNETENQARLRRAKEALTSYQSAENEARRTLACAMESTKRAREKYETIFIAEEKAESARLRGAYNHCTK